MNGDVRRSIEDMVVVLGFDRRLYVYGGWCRPPFQKSRTIMAKYVGIEVDGSGGPCEEIRKKDEVAVMESSGVLK